MMTIPHLDLQIEYLTAIKAGKRMEWRSTECGPWSGWASAGPKHPAWLEMCGYEIREVPRRQYIPRSEVPRAMGTIENKLLAWTIDPYYSDPLIEVVAGDGARHGNGWLWATESDARAAWAAMSAREEE